MRWFLMMMLAVGLVGCGDDGSSESGDGASSSSTTDGDGGTLALGDACDEDSQCPAPARCAGTCRSINPGDPCETADHCVAGLQCVEGACSNAAGDDGLACTEDEDCEAGKACDVVDDVCKQAVIEGLEGRGTVFSSNAGGGFVAKTLRFSTSNGVPPRVYLSHEGREFVGIESPGVLATNDSEHGREVTNVCDDAGACVVLLGGDVPTDIAIPSSGSATVTIIPEPGAATDWTIEWMIGG